MLAFGRTVVIVVAALACLPSAHIYSQSNPTQDIEQIGDSEDTSEPARQITIESPNPTVVQSGPVSTLDELSPNYYGQTILPVTGKIMFYNPGIMEIVIKNRQKAGDISECGDCIGFAALLRAGDLDRKIWIQFADELVEGPFHVVDVAAPQHVLMLLGKEWVADVDYETAMRWRMAGPRIGMVLSEPPAEYISPLDLHRYSLVTPSDLSAPVPYRNEKLSQNYLLVNEFDVVNELLVR